MPFSLEQRRRKKKKKKKENSNTQKERNSTGKKNSLFSKTSTSSPFLSFSFHFCALKSISVCTTPGSASVDVSPSWSSSPLAILRRILRMIFPDLVLGRPGAQWMASGVAMGPIDDRTCAISSFRRDSGGV